MALGFGKVFEKSTFIKWDYKMLQNRSRSASGYINVQDPNQIEPVEWEPLSVLGHATWANYGRSRWGENRALLELTVGAPRGLKYSENRDFLEWIYNARKVNKHFAITFDPEWLNATDTTTQNAISSGELVVLSDLNYLMPQNKGTLRQEDVAYCISGFPLGSSPINIYTGWTWITSYGGFTARQLPYARAYIFNNYGALNHYPEDTVILKAGDWLMQPSNNAFAADGTLRYRNFFYAQVPYQVVNDVILRGAPGDFRYFYDTGGELPLPAQVGGDAGGQGSFFISRNNPANVSAPDFWVSGTLMGSNVYFSLIPKKIPNYRILPHDIVEFEGDFVFQEVGTRNL